MKTQRLLKRLIGAGAVAMSGAMLLGTSTANAATTGTSPGWFTSKGVNTIRSAGSETSYYLMARIGDLFTQTSIFGCQLATSDFQTCNTGNDLDTTDALDDYSRQEYTNGAGVGSTTGIGQLCGAKPVGTAAVPDFARSSRGVKSGETGPSCPSGTATFTNNGNVYSGPVGLGFADDSIPGLVFPNQGATALSCKAAGGTCAATQIGPVAAGWTPQDAVTCTPRTFGDTFTAGHCHNYPLVSVDNFTLPGETSNTSGMLFRIQCGTSNADPKLSKIFDWGQITDPTLTSDSLTYTDANNASQTITLTKGQEGIGAPIGVPIYVPAVNTGSGTESVWGTYSNCGGGGTGLVDQNGDAGNLVQENDAPQLYDIGQKGGHSGGAASGTTDVYMGNQETPAASNASCGGTTSTCGALESSFFPATSVGNTNGAQAATPNGDNIYASNLVASSLYYISLGVSVWQPHTRAAGNFKASTGLNGTGIGPLQGVETSIDQIPPSTTNENKTQCTPANSCSLIGTARQLNNVINPEHLRASTLGFMNWICDTDISGVHHGIDLTNGKNYSNELGATISTIYFFPREDCSGFPSTTTANTSGGLIPTDTSS